jgi:hypothetical protein
VIRSSTTELSSLSCVPSWERQGIKVEVERSDEQGSASVTCESSTKVAQLIVWTSGSAESSGMLSSVLRNMIRFGIATDPHGERAARLSGRPNGSADDGRLILVSQNTG